MYASPQVRNLDLAVVALWQEGQISVRVSGQQMSRSAMKLARRGAYLARAGDPPPGNIVMWRGMRRLTDIQLGYELAPADCG
jgi:hypothetical protein